MVRRKFEVVRSTAQAAITMALILQSAAIVLAKEVDRRAGNTQTNSWSYQRNLQEFRSRDITSIPEIPNLPGFTGRCKFQDGAEFPHIASGRVVNYRFAAMEAPDDVAAWYRSALAISGWELDGAVLNQRALQATRGSDQAQIMVMPSSIRGFRSDVLVLYQAGNQRND